MKFLIVIPVYNEVDAVRRALPDLCNVCMPGNRENCDLLIVDDGSTDLIEDILEEHDWMLSVKHEVRLGYGGCFLTGLQYARDFNYDCMIMLDPGGSDFFKDVPVMMENIKYGYDIVSCSRILENYDYSHFPPSYIQITGAISDVLFDITGETLTDPLSGIKAIQIKSFEQMDLTEFDHGLLLQLWVQAAFYGLTFIEIPASSGESFGSELEMTEDPLECYLAVLETERYLYNKNSPH